LVRPQPEEINFFLFFFFYHLWYSKHKIGKKTIELMSLTYHYLIMPQKDFFQNEAFEEILRERANFYFNQDKKKDFWLIPFPEFVKDQNFLEKIKETNFYNQKTPLFFSSNLVALISSNEDFIKWVELRVGYFENIESKNSLKNYHISNGISGKIQLHSQKNFESLNSPLKYSSNALDTTILLSKYKTFLASFSTI